MAKSRAPKTVEFNMPLKTPKGGGKMPVYSRVGHYTPIPKGSGNRRATPAKTTREVTEVPKTEPKALEGGKPLRQLEGGKPVRAITSGGPRALEGPRPRALEGPRPRGAITAGPRRALPAPVRGAITAGPRRAIPLSAAQQNVTSTTTTPPKKTTPKTTTTTTPKPTTPKSTTTKPTTPKPPTPPPATTGPRSVLGVHEGATKAQINAAFRKLSKQYHPDINPAHKDGKKMREINAAYQELTDGN